MSKIKSSPEGMMAWHAAQYAENRWTGCAKVKRQRTVDDFIAGALWMRRKVMTPLLDEIVESVEREKVYRKQRLLYEDGSAIQALTDVLRGIESYRKTGGF